MEGLRARILAGVADVESNVPAQPLDASVSSDNVPPEFASQLADPIAIFEVYGLSPLASEAARGNAMANEIYANAAL